MKERDSGSSATWGVYGQGRLSIERGESSQGRASDREQLSTSSQGQNTSQLDHEQLNSQSSGGGEGPHHAAAGQQAGEAEHERAGHLIRDRALSPGAEIKPRGAAWVSGNSKWKEAISVPGAVDTSSQEEN